MKYLTQIILLVNSIVNLIAMAFNYSMATGWIEDLFLVLIVICAGMVAASAGLLNYTILHSHDTDDEDDEEVEQGSWIEDVPKDIAQGTIDYWLGNMEAHNFAMPQGCYYRIGAPCESENDELWAGLYFVEPSTEEESTPIFEEEESININKIN